MTEASLDDLLDRLVAEYSDRIAAGAAPRRETFLERVPPEARPGLERCLKMIDAGLGEAPSGARPLSAGMRLGRYELVREIGRGGMALVWLARDHELARAVALKLLRPGLALETRHVDRFRREALAIAKLRHPHIVQIFDVGAEHGYHYIAMEFVEGPSLATVLAALPPARGAGGRARGAEDLVRASGIPALGARDASYEQAICRLLAPVAEALQEAHARGLVHRDVKPSNVLLQKDGRAVVADFGLAKADEDPALSITGDTLGTPYYMSPEQAWLSETHVDHRTDVYSLGVTLYEALAGERPFEGRSVLEVFEAIKTQVPPGLRSVAPATTRDAAAVVRRAMARDPERRYASAADLRAELVALGEGAATAARRAEGGALKRAWLQVRLSFSGQPYEYRSRTTFLGLPLVHVVRGRRLPGQRLRVAKGWFASGDVAIGGIATGPFAFGGIACGGIAGSALFSWGGIAVGLGASFGGLSAATLAIGGVALGFLAYGGAAFGYGAVGGYARGVYAIGGSPHGRHAWGGGEQDEAALRWFEGVAPWLLRLFGSPD